jgi:hypothetical protein
MMHFNGYLNKTALKLFVVSLPIIVPVCFSAIQQLPQTASWIEMLRVLFRLIFTVWLVLYGVFRVSWIPSVIGCMVLLGSVTIFFVTLISLWHTKDFFRILLTMAAQSVGIFLYALFLLRDSDLIEHRRAFSSHIPNRLKLPS